MKSKFFKLIFTLTFIVAIFCTFNFTAFADPLTGAMIASQIASGFGFAGFASSPAETVSDLTGDFYVDLVPWTDLVTAAHAYVTIRDLVTPANSVEIELSPEISEAGYERTNQFVSHYSINPGSVVNLGTFYTYNGYAFNKTVNISGYSYKYGAIVGYSPSAYTIPGAFSIGACSLSFLQNGQGSSFISTSTIGNAASTTKVINYTNYGFNLYFLPSYNEIGWKFSQSNTVFGGKRTADSGINTVSQVSYNVSRSNDSEVINPNNRSNVVVIPASYVTNINYQSGEAVIVEEEVIAALDAIASAGANSDISSSTYTNPDPPVTETIAETPWSYLTEWFGDFTDYFDSWTESFGDWSENVFSGWTEVFGDIYDEIHGFKESFGDWVDDVASGWTEVFGDIYDTLTGWTEVFGDIYDGIIDGFGDIADILEGIYDYVADIVQEIVNADANWVNGFINNFLSQFQDWFDTLKQHVSIWHYVVEWLASIRSVFTFFFGVMSNTGYNFVLPIYACFAGTVVIAIYRRFGK